jgi:ketosteroid isomerase-like protein
MPASTNWRSFGRPVRVFGHFTRLTIYSTIRRSKDMTKEDSMKKLAPLVIATALLTTAFAASAQSLTEEQARTVIAPWYRLFNQPVNGDMRTLQEQVLTADYESCWGYLPGECWGRDASIKVVGGFAKSIPDMKFEIKEVLVAGDRAIVRGEVTGTPAGDLFGVPHTGKSFRIMAIDIQTIQGGKIARTYHIENWLSALGQLRAK